jgi:membrane protein DedA with SNARE-associated domain
VTGLLDQLMHVPSAAVLVIVGVLVFGEAAVFLGFVLPGEAAVLLGGSLASTGRLSVVLLAVVVVLAAITGDSLGYEVGKRFGARVVQWPMMQRHGDRIDRARQFLDGRGAPAVFIGRGTALLRALMPGLAGLSGMRYPRFLFWNALGGLVWGVGCVLAGYLAGSSYQKVAGYLGKGGAAVIAAVVVLAVIVWHVKRRRGSDGPTQGGERGATEHAG